jgi:hypothetical protein
LKLRSRIQSETGFQPLVSPSIITEKQRFEESFSSGVEDVHELVESFLQIDNAQLRESVLNLVTSATLLEANENCDKTDGLVRFPA